jgi:hypothetical protein
MRPSPLIDIEAVIKHVDQRELDRTVDWCSASVETWQPAKTMGAIVAIARFLCRCAPTSEPVAGARDGTATIRQLRWLRLDDERHWGREITNDRFLYPQLQAIRSAITQHGSAG